jgi:hypothetical protein
MSANPIIWWELATHDQEKSVKFFEKVFGWEFRFDGNVGFYKMISLALQILRGALERTHLQNISARRTCPRRVVHFFQTFHSRCYAAHQAFPRTRDVLCDVIIDPPP